MESKSYVDETENVKSNTKKRRWIIVLILFCVVAIIALGILYFISEKTSIVGVWIARNLDNGELFFAELRNDNEGVFVKFGDEVQNCEWKYEKNDNGEFISINDVQYKISKMEMTAYVLTNVETQESLMCTYFDADYALKIVMNSDIDEEYINDAKNARYAMQAVIAEGYGYRKYEKGKEPNFTNADYDYAEKIGKLNGDIISVTVNPDTLNITRMIYKNNYYSKRGNIEYIKNIFSNFEMVDYNSFIDKAYNLQTGTIYDKVVDYFPYQYPEEYRLLVW